jgi:hypothetical protein
MYDLLWFIAPPYDPREIVGVFVGRLLKYVKDPKALPTGYWIGVGSNPGDTALSRGNSLPVTLEPFKKRT